MKLLTTNIPGDYLHYCPGCKGMHQINTQRKNDNGAQWAFNGNMEVPSFTPSVHISSTNRKGVRHTSCHYFITVGMIQFCGDSQHELKGLTVELPEIPEDYKP